MLDLEDVREIAARIPRDPLDREHLTVAERLDGLAGAINGLAPDVLAAATRQRSRSKLLSYPRNRFNPRDERERARYAGYALALRAAEAITLRHYATGLRDGQGRQRALIVLGDLNDEPLAATTKILLGPPGSEIDTRGFDLDDAGDALRLWNLAPRILPEDRRFSRVFNGRPELIDHILVSHALVHDVDSVTTGTADLSSVTVDPGERRDATASDHAPVIARFGIG